MAGEEVAHAFVGFAGLMGDRAFAFVRTSGPRGFPWHTGREQEDLVLFRPTSTAISNSLGGPAIIQGGTLLEEGLMII